MAGHAQLKFVMTECSKTQIRLTGLILLLHYQNFPDKSECSLREKKGNPTRKSAMLFSRVSKEKIKK